MDRSEALTRLHEIERELDKTDPRESPPYRSVRAKLNREKSRLLRKLEGNDPIRFVLGEEGCYNSLTKNQKELYRVKKRVLDILTVLKKAEGPEWWEKFK